MIDAHTEDSTPAEAGVHFALLPSTPVVSDERMLANVRHSLSLGLPEFQFCRAHKHELSVAAGGPSLADTYTELRGYIVAVNGSLKWLLERGVVPYACGVMDPGEHMADIIVADPRVRYFVASCCDASVFEKLRGCDVTLWHASGLPGLEDVLEERLGATWKTVGGGATMGLRWLNLGYMLGFRAFHLHGLDSSFRGVATHAYPDRDHQVLRILAGERITKKSFLAQVSDFLRVLETFERDMEPIAIKVYGDGLLQDSWAMWHRAKPRSFQSC
jgi:hypothetical protein